MASNTRKSTEIYLIGTYESQIIGNKLPSNKQVLSVLFYNIKQVKLTVDNSVDLTIKETLVFWEKARIPTKQFSKCGKKLKSLYEELRNLQKSRTRRSERTKKNEEDFVNKLDNLFDIAHANAMEIITIEEDKVFLINQRKPGRIGCLGGVDMIFKKREDQTAEKTEEKQQRKRKAQEETSLLCKFSLVPTCFYPYF